MENDTNGAILPLTVEFALRANPHVKFSIADIDPAWAKLPKAQIERIENDLEGSGLFLSFGKKGKLSFMLKDSCRNDLIAAGSYENYMDSRKNFGEMSEGERAAARLRDQEDNIRRTDDNSRGRKKRSDKAILIAGIAILIVVLVIAKILLGKIAKP